MYYASYGKFEDFQLRQSIWENIEELVQNTEERHEIKKVIGNSIVEETLDLHNELHTLYGIWKEYHEERNNIVCRSPIPEPPLLRENLEKQITLMVDLLQEKMKKQGHGGMPAFLTEEEKKMIKSVSSGNKSEEQIKPLQSSSVKCDTPSSGYNSRCSSALSIDMTALQESISLVDIDSIAQHLREDFEEERRLLLNDISYIQNAMINEDEEFERGKLERQSSPTIKDLRSLSMKLENEVLHNKVVISKSKSLSKSVSHVDKANLKKKSGHVRSTLPTTRRDIDFNANTETTQYKHSCEKNGSVDTITNKRTILPHAPSPPRNNSKRSSTHNIRKHLSSRKRSDEIS